MKDYREMTTAELLMTRSDIEQKLRTVAHERARAIREQDTALAEDMHTLKTNYEAAVLRLNSEFRAKRQEVRDEEFRQRSELIAEHNAIDAELSGRSVNLNTDEQ